MEKLTSYNLYKNEYILSIDILSILYSSSKNNVEINKKNIKNFVILTKYPFLYYKNDSKKRFELLYRGFTETNIEYMNIKHVYENINIEDIINMLLLRNLIKTNKSKYIYKISDYGIEKLFDFKTSYCKNVIYSSNLILQDFKDKFEEEIEKIITDIIF